MAEEQKLPEQKIPDYPDNKDVMTITLTEYLGWKENTILIQEWWKAKELIESGTVRLVDHAKDHEAIAKRMKREEAIIKAAGK